MNALKYHWCETSLFLSQADLKHVVSKDSRSLCKEPVLYPTKNEEIYGIVPCQTLATFKKKFQHVGHMWVTSRLFCGSVGQMGQQM